MQGISAALQPRTIKTAKCLRIERENCLKITRKRVLKPSQACTCVSYSLVRCHKARPKSVSSLYIPLIWNRTRSVTFQTCHTVFSLVTTPTLHIGTARSETVEGLQACEPSSEAIRSLVRPAAPPASLICPSSPFAWRLMRFELTPQTPHYC